MITKRHSITFALVAGLIFSSGMVIAGDTTIEDLQPDAFKPGVVPDPNAPAYHLQEGGKYIDVRKRAADIDPDLPKQEVRPVIENSDTSIIYEQPRIGE
jgi:hypothetical protein